ncbi:ComEC/Rec2 family competence protein [Winogradskyella psychrotolerans]|uniref:ComEC/Rec2 family competence protein n=1 Tax=Winogradskyella psychrotolerans TaxID=1344585 RepID=UPI001C067DCC|nr:ComEC/Rec2 family competence protein [Winogradskyella psychrotolerans]MBU2927637.1 ComEC family competence protein [Winogradskyella psychrotolerans]
MKLLNFTIIKLTIFLVTGILLAHYIKLDFYSILYVTIALVILLGLYWLILKSKINRSPFFGILAYLCMIAVGMTSYTIQNEKLRPDHYTNLKASENTNTIIFKIKERLKPDAYNDKYIVSLKSFNKQDAIGHLLINIKRDSIPKQYHVDDILFTSAELNLIQKPLNPHQFDYSKYLELQQIYHQLYLNLSTILQLSDSKSTIYGYADALRTKINAKLIEAGFKDDALSIMNALLLGQRQTIDKTVYNNYVNSGTIHILAVSGLHVGIILIILNFLFKPLLYLKYGHVIKPFILVSILWSFAVIAGLRPSVTRAVTMFSVITIAMHLKRRTNIYNTLVISAFLILLFKPTFLFAVGFQMSYLAVLSIVSIQPMIYKLWQPKYWIIDQPWQIFTVTLAAQVGVAPISLYYFHQFPGLFFISNLVVIPFLGLILGFGMLVIALALIDFLLKPIVDTYSFIIDTLNGFIAWVAQFESFLLRDIPFTIFQVITSYLIIATLVQTYKFRNFRWLAMSLIAIISLQSVTFYNKYKAQSHEFIIFNKSRYSMIGFKDNQKLTVAHNLDSAKLNSDYAIQNYKIGEAIIDLDTDSLASVYQYKNNTLLVIDSLAVYKNLTLQPNYILLRNSPRLNLNRVIDSLKPQLIIADASNYKSYLKRWKETCVHKKIPFHQTNEKGAFIIK